MIRTRIFGSTTEHLENKEQTMDISNKAIITAWGKKILTDYGYEVSEGDSVFVVLDTESSGCCEVCLSHEPVIVITRKWDKVYLREIDEAFSSLLDFARQM